MGRDRGPSGERKNSRRPSTKKMTDSALCAVPPGQLIEVGFEFCEGEIEFPEGEKLTHHPHSA